MNYFIFYRKNNGFVSPKKKNRGKIIHKKRIKCNKRNAICLMTCVKKRAKTNNINRILVNNNISRKKYIYKWHRTNKIVNRVHTQSNKLFAARTDFGIAELWQGYAAFPHIKSAKTNDMTFHRVTQIAWEREREREKEAQQTTWKSIL